MHREQVRLTAGKWIRVLLQLAALSWGPLTPYSQSTSTRMPRGTRSNSLLSSSWNRDHHIDLPVQNYCPRLPLNVAQMCQSRRIRHLIEVVPAVLDVIIVHRWVRLCFWPSDALGVTLCSLKVKNIILLTLKITEGVKWRRWLLL